MSGLRARIVRSALVLVPFSRLATAAWSADALDGIYKGDLHCAAVPGLGPLNVAITVTVGAGHAGYSRSVLSPDGKEAIGMETGIGMVASDGTIALSGTASGKTYRAAASYQRKIESGNMALTGVHDWVIQDRQPFRRNCTASLVC